MEKVKTARSPKRIELKLRAAKITKCAFSVRNFPSKQINIEIIQSF